MVPNRELFDDWLVEMDNRLDMLRDEVPEEVASRLDFSPSSLTALETWMISEFATLSDVKSRDHYLLDRLATYVGETFRKRLGATWDLSDSNPKDVFYGLPVVRTPNGSVDGPHSIVSACFSRRKGNYMQTILDNH